MVPVILLKNAQIRVELTLVAVQMGSECAVPFHMDVGLPQLKIVPILNLPPVVQRLMEALAE